MSGLSAKGRICVLVLAAVFGFGPRARAIEFLDGALQIHGFGEMQIRGLSKNWSAADDWDVAQWYNVLNVEIEADIFPDGWGPFSLLSAYARIEGRFDCVWSRCGFLNTDFLGNRATHLPHHFSNARRTGLTGVQFTGDTRRRNGVPIEELGFLFKDNPVGDRRQPAFLWNVSGLDTLFGGRGPDDVLGTADDPAKYVFARMVKPGDQYRFAQKKIKGPAGGVGTQVLGPWRPSDKIEPHGFLADRANPFRAGDVNPVMRNPATGLPITGSTALPYRPAPTNAFTSTSPLTQARGIYYPSAPLAQMIGNDEFDNFDQNFREEELEWNHGASQQDEKELKELYFDMEFFDGQLWVRAGKQNIVWGKTELFRTTDQFDPVDLALASLPSLEESRIPLWSVRAVWAFYTVGPLEDVRLELAFNFDQFEPNDLGRCGEAFTPDPVCNKSAGLWAHGLTGYALAGEVRPPNPWNSFHGLEYGARLEFRWDRFSFQISDFYGFNDLPYIDRITTYERNVDPRTGRPRELHARGSCTTGNEPACLTPAEALTKHSVNQQLFAMICATTIGFSDLDRSVCAQSVFNSQDTTATPLGIAGAIGRILAGDVVNGAGDGALILNAIGGVPIPNALNLMVALNLDPQDCTGAACGAGILDPTFPNLPNFLTDEQEALLGCGPFYGTDCGADGIDLLNAEASALFQAFPGFEGTEGVFWDTRSTVPQPGTVGFMGGPVCTRYEGGQLLILPGCRGPGDAGYDPNVDGTTTADGFGAPLGANTDKALIHPLTGQPFRSEMAALSWNFLMLLVAFSTNASNPSAVTALDATQLFNPNRCSFATPQLCSNVQAIFAVVGTNRNTVRAAGNGRYGRRDFVWHSGGEGVLRYDKRNVFGFSMDFAEDVTKSNWGLEATWIHDLPVSDRNVFDGIRSVDQYNVTISVDRPTFVNFLNQNRTFFLNSQWFFQYIDGYRRDTAGTGPFNVLATFTVQTGYFQDRLLASNTVVYHFNSGSGALLPSVTYRFTENFSAQVGVAFFWGRFQRRHADLNPIAPVGENVGRSFAYHTFEENGLAVVRDRDEAFLRLRYTF